MDWLGLKEEHKMLRHDIKRFAETELEPTLLEIDKESKPHVEALKKIAELGILGILVPEQYGGAEMDMLSLVITIEELGKVSPSFALSVAAHNMVAHTVAVEGSDEVKKQYLPKLATGELVAGLGIGTALHAIGEKERGRFVINGSFAQLIGYSTQDEEKSVFTIEKPEGTLEAERELMGMRASGICLLKPGGKSLTQGTFKMTRPDEFFSTQRLLLAAIACGICDSVLNQSITYAKERYQFGRPIASFGMVRIMLAEMATFTHASRMLVYQAAADGTVLERNMSGEFAVEHALVVTDHGVQIYGGYGYTKDYPLEMFFRDAKVLEILAGSAEYLKVALGKALIQ
jgi:alkylation response protein AidB-like acyl-CoA dehydrogenase